MAYSEPRGVLLRIMATGETHLLPDTANMVVLGWRSDGASIRARRELSSTEREYWDLSVLGGRQRATAGKLSPDGKRAVTTGDLNRQVIVTDAGGGSPRVLAEYSVVNATIEGLEWSPDSRFLVVAVAMPPGSQPSALETIDTMSGVRNRIEAPSQGFGISGAVMLPDWRVIYTARDSVQRGGGYNLWSVPIKAGDGTASAPAQRLTNLTGFRIGLLSVTSDGKTVAFLKLGGAGHTYVANVRRGNLGIESMRRLTKDEWDDVPTAWSADDRFVYFMTTRNGSADVMRQSVDQEKPETLADGPGVQSGPRTPPWTSWVLITTRPSTRDPPVVARVPAAGGLVERILDSPGLLHYRCGERATCILVERVDGDDVIYELDPVKGKGSELFRKPSRTGDPAVSPDGASIAFLTGEGTHTIRLVTLHGEPIRDIDVPGDKYLQSLDWAPDGSGFFTNLNTESETSLAFVPLKGSPRVLMSDKRFVVSWSVPSHDGKKLAIFAATQTSDVWTVSGF
jgi:Tol biopolymer transport system component